MEWISIEENRNAGRRYKAEGSMPIRRIDYSGSMEGPEELGQNKDLPNDEGTPQPSGFDSNDLFEAAKQPDSFNAAVNFSGPLTETQHAQIGTAAAKLLSDLPDIVRSANYDPQKVADGIDLHIQNSLTQTEWSVLGNMNGQDIEALAFLVLMQASKSAQEDLKSIMDGVKAINKQKEGWRQVSETINRMTASFPNDDDDK